jgi:tRNA A37 threonylcarbamoyladenosine modification protein TsaB
MLNKSTLAIVIVLLLAGGLLAQTLPEPNLSAEGESDPNSTGPGGPVNALAAEPDPEFVAVSRLETVAANEEFRRNAALVARQLQAVQALNSQVEEAGTQAIREELVARRDAQLAKLNENNRKMIQTYGYNVTRDYRIVVEKAHIYMYVTPEELAEIQERSNPDPRR